MLPCTGISLRGPSGCTVPFVLFLAPAGVALLGVLDVVHIGLVTVLPVIPFVMALYYLVWKFVVGFLNREMGVG